MKTERESLNNELSSVPVCFLTSITCTVSGSVMSMLDVFCTSAVSHSHLVPSVPTPNWSAIEFLATRVFRSHGFGRTDHQKKTPIRMPAATANPAPNPAALRTILFQFSIIETLPHLGSE